MILITCAVTRKFKKIPTKWLLYKKAITQYPAPSSLLGY
jgi:hypothetical protein